MKYFTLSAFLLLFSFSHAQYNCQSLKSTFKTQAATPPINNNGKSDTLDVLHYHLALDMTSIHANQMEGEAKITLLGKQNNITSVPLELIQLSVDSILFEESTTCSFQYNSGPKLSVSLPQTINASDTFSLTVFYHGMPKVDASGWGGFHRNAPYFFNLGVGFDANPHTYGRSWFPCFDNFVERSTYSFDIKTRGGMKAYCNGLRTLLDSTTFGGDTVVSHWEMTSPIPTYLASVAISNYQEIRYQKQGMPFLILARPNDTASAKSAFGNLDSIYSSFVQRYGPYHWQKVGYALTTIGAMEHATSIHYPRTSLSNEDIIAHELAHHWFGNLITCETAGDMWINEGMAEYLSHQYEEDLYGLDDYKTATVNNHSYVIQYSPIVDGAHLALKDLPNELTYGVHTYQKGAMVGHNLRGYLGDSLFFYGLQKVLNDNKFSSVSSTKFRDELTVATGYNLTSFFDDWVFHPGYPDLNVDSFYLQSTALPEHEVFVKVSQRTLATNKLFSNMPIEITLHDAQGNQQTHHVIFSGADSVYKFNVPFAANWANINEDDHIFTAVAGRNFLIKNGDFFNDTRVKMRVNAGLVNDTVPVRIEHHWAGPSVRGDENFRVSQKRYWRVSGAFPINFQPEVRLEFSAFPNTGNLDDDLLAHGEDSLILVYRKDATEAWREYDFYSKDYVGNPNNKFGRINISPLIPGEFAFANGVSKFVIDENVNRAFNLYPNPTSNKLIVERFAETQNQHWQIINDLGQEVHAGKFDGDTTEIDVSTLLPGTYFFSSQGQSTKFVVVD